MSRNFLFATVLAGALLGALWSGDAYAEKRVALVIGNSSYQNVAELPNPASDASAIAQMLRGIGFDVDVQVNLGYLAMKRAIRKFEDFSGDADMAVVFFAGHGLEVGGVNYLIPVDARLVDERDVEDEAIPLDKIVAAINNARQLRIIMVDACRDNPFTKMKRRSALRDMARGLARIEPGASDTLVAYAARAGSVAEDGHGMHSPFTTALLDNLPVPGLDIRIAFGKIRDEVLKITDNRQEPFVYGSLGGGNIALVPKPVAPNQPTTSDLRADYELAKDIGTVEAWDAFLKAHPNGFYAELARAAQDKVVRNKMATLEPPVPPPSPLQPVPDDQRVWSQIDTNNANALQEFIKRFPNSPISLTAQRRLDLLNEQADTKAAQQDWEKLKQSSDQAAIQGFIKRYPNSPLVASAQARLAIIQQQIAKDQDAKAQAEWNSTKDSGDQSVIQSFIARYPNSPLVASAQNRLTALQQAARIQEAKDESDWNSVKDSSDRAALEAYIARHPNSQFRQKAEAKLETLEKATKEQEAKAQAEWNKIKDTADQDALRAFIKRFPASSLVASAQDRLAKLQQKADQLTAEKQAAEQQAAADWAKLRDSDDQAGLQSFITRYPASLLQQKAQARLEALQRAAKELEAKAQAEWNRIKDTPEQDTLRAFIKQFPASSLVASAQDRLVKLQQKADQLTAEKQAAEQQAAADWAKLKDSNDQAGLQSFITRYPASLLQQKAQARLDVLQRAAKELDAKAQAEWNKIKDAGDQDSLIAFTKRFPNSTLVTSAQARLAVLQQMAQQQAVDKQVEADWAKLKDSDDQVSLQSFILRYSDSRLAQDAQRRLDNLQKLAAEKTEQEKAKTGAVAAPQQVQQEPAAAGNQTAASGATNAPPKVATLEPPNGTTPTSEAVAGAPVESHTNSELVHQAQIELSRLGCFGGIADGTLNSATEAGIKRYLSKKGNRDTQTKITEGFLSELREQQSRVCPLECGKGETARGDVCIADKKPSDKKQVREEVEPPRKKTQAASVKPAERERRSRLTSEPASPQVHQEVTSTPQYHGGGGGGGGTIGVGF